jgi:adenine-specific DNA-methyltransferase
VLARARAEVLVVSYNDEAWLSAGEIAGHLGMLRERCEVLTFDAKRYVGAQIGIFNRAGERVGEVGRLRNREFVFVAGPAARVEAAVARVRGSAAYR